MKDILPIYSSRYIGNPQSVKLLLADYREAETRQAYAKDKLEEINARLTRVTGVMHGAGGCSGHNIEDAEDIRVALLHRKQQLEETYRSSTEIIAVIDDALDTLPEEEQELVYTLFIDKEDVGGEVPLRIRGMTRQTKSRYITGLLRNLGKSIYG